jgi:hypothetical protein
VTRRHGTSRSLGCLSGLLISALTALVPLACGSTAASRTDGGASGAGAGASGAGAGAGGAGGAGASGTGGGRDGGGGAAGTSPSTDGPVEQSTSPFADAGAADDAARGEIPMFVAVGSRFRRIISCDDGLTWVADQMDTSSANDETAGSRGLGAGGGLFVAATGGGGMTARIFSSIDGVIWTERVPLGVYNGFSQVAYGAGYYVAGGGNISIRSKTGTSGWGEEASMGQGGVLRHLAFGAGKFVAVGGGRIQQSTDAAAWAGPASGACAGEVIDVVFGNGRFLAVGSGGVTCLSGDGGMTWTNGTVGGTGLRGLVWTGHDFLACSPDKTYRSPDGTTWSSTSGGGPDLMAVSDKGTFAGISGSTFYRSTDGMAWTKIPVTSGNPLYGFTRLVFGRGSRSGVCPGP